MPSQKVFIYNSLTKEKEEFIPVNEGTDKIGMYVCGPTVYGDPHLGHARSAITFDIVYRYLEYVGYKVRYVRNITDVGHLEDELSGTGDDKIAKKAKLEKVEPMEIVQRYTNNYHFAMDELNVLRPSIEPSATGHIIEQIETIQKIIEQGFAYEVNGSVYFDMEAYTKKYKYGELSGKVLEELQSGSRDLDGQSEKRAPFDFALWKHAKPEHIMKWSSPWGIGFPGWHLECTAMSAKYLGVPFDIHGGGMDLQFPHHEGEIAQCQGAHGKAPVKYWMHNNMVTLDSQKMAKSKGNFINLDEMFSGNHKLLEKAYSPMTIRFFMLQSHYRSTIDFSNEALQAAEKGLKRLLNALSILAKLNPETNGADEALNKEIETLCTKCFEYMNDDFNTAQTLAALFDLSSKIQAFDNKQLPLEGLSAATFGRLKQTFSDFVLIILGIKPEENTGDDKLDQLINWVIELRKGARADKDWALSDKIRDELAEIGILLKDSKEGTSYSID